MVSADPKIPVTARGPTKHKRRFCKVEGCSRIVKSQGVCQRHGAKPCKCRVDGCNKQAQGNFNGMCKAHFRESPQGGAQADKDGTNNPVCRVVSTNWGAALARNGNAPPELLVSQDTTTTSSSTTHPENNGSQGRTDSPTLDRSHQAPRVLSFHKDSAYATSIPASIGWSAGSTEETNMPLVQALAQGSSQPAGWHRNAERAARSLEPVPPGTALEGWEMELLFIQTLLLSGTTQEALEGLAHGWAQTAEYYKQLGRLVCGAASHHNDTHEVSEGEDVEAPVLVSSPKIGSTEMAKPSTLTTADRKKSPLDTLIALLAANDA